MMYGQEIVMDFVYDNNKNLKILDPAFNGWERKRLTKMMLEYERMSVNNQELKELIGEICP